MQLVEIAGTGLRVSRFVFGTDRIFNIGNAARREALLEAAVEAGFTHFDTAPYYGFGHAERDLAPILRRHPHVTVTTKVGIHSPGGEEQPAWAVWARKAAGRALPVLSRPAIDFSLQRAERALTGSLRRMGRERIDIYTMHEPDVALFSTDEWQRWFEAKRQAGVVRAFGVAMPVDRLEPVLADAPGLAQVVQMQDSLDTRQADILARHGRPLQITYGYVSAARAAGVAVSVSDVLRQALARNHEGAIVVTTSKPERLGQYAALLEARA